MGLGEDMTAPESSPTATFMLPRHANIEGSLTYLGALVVSGTIDGDVTCISLIVTERGIINGSVRADSATVLGEVNGEIFANALTLKTACSVMGDIFHNHLVLEDGCYFEGRSRRMILPLEIVA